MFLSIWDLTEEKRRLEGVVREKRRREKQRMDGETSCEYTYICELTQANRRRRWVSSHSRQSAPGPRFSPRGSAAMSSSHDRRLGLDTFYVISSSMDSFYIM